MARFTLPRDLYHGPNALEALKTLPGKRAMICVGGGSMKRFGFLDRVEAYLKEAGMEVELFEGIEPDPSVTTVMNYQDHQSHGLSAKCCLRNLTVTRKQIIQMNHLDKIVKELSYRNRKDNHTEPDNRRCPHEILSVSTESLFPSLLIFSVKQIQNNTSRHISDQSHIQGTL